MKKSIIYYVEIALTLSIIAGWFMPYTKDYLPIEFIYPIEYHFLTFNLTIPLLVTIPYLLLLIFRNLLGNSLLQLFKVIFLLLFLFTFGYYIFMLIEVILDGLDGSDFVSLAVAIMLSLTLLLLNFKYILLKSDRLQNIMLATMTLPYILYLLVFSIDVWNFNYGGYIINIAFLSLYVIALINVFRNYKLKKL